MIVVAMGVCGSGKTSVGKAIASQLSWTFIEGDDLHPSSNKAKMASGVPLTDQDRWPWLDAIADRLGSGSRMLVLDHVEHVIDASSDVAALLGAAPGVTVLATSQAPLRIRGEKIYPVPPLGAVEGVELFVELVFVTVDERYQ